VSCVLSNLSKKKLFNFLLLVMFGGSANLPAINL